MITKDIKISKLLKEYPGSLDILLNASPHFHKLQNKLLRKALAGRVTVEQAASIADVNLDNLLFELNNAVKDTNKRVTFSEENHDSNTNVKSSNAKKPEYIKSLTDDKMFYLDVRPILNAGKDPLKDIMKNAKTIKTGEALIVINSFEPVPLYSILEKKGFLHWAENENDLWKVYFYKNEVPDKNKKSEDNVQMKIDEKDFKNIIELDVHELQPPEPMMKILENLSKINPDTVMRIHHHREPLLLYPKLEERGYQAVCYKLGEDNYKILIAKKVKECSPPD